MFFLEYYPGKDNPALRHHHPSPTAPSSRSLYPFPALTHKAVSLTLIPLKISNLIFLNV